MVRLKKYIEWMSRGRRTNRIAYVSGVLAVVRGDVLNLAGRDPADHDGVADGVGGAFLAFRTARHQTFQDVQ